MKKILITLLLLVIAAVAVVPFLIGSQIEKTTKQLVQTGNQQLANLVQSNPQFESGSVAIDRYDKGYLSSSAVGTLKIGLMNEAGSKQLEIPFNTDITHGPYLGDAGFGLARIISRPDLSSLELPEAINKDTVTIEGLVDFSQNLTETMTVAPIKHRDEAGNIVDFGGAIINNKSHVQNRSTFKADVSIEQLQLSNAETENLLTLKPFKMDVEGQGDSNFLNGSYQAASGVIEASMGKEVSLVLQKMAIAGNYQKAKQADFMLGDGALSLSDLVITNPSALTEPLQMPELMFKSKLEQSSNNDLTMSIEYEGTLHPSLMKLMGSPVDIKTAEFDLQFKAIPVEVVTDYQQLVRDLMAETDQQKASETMQAKVFEMIQMLASNAASTHLDLKAKTEEGDLIADIDTGFKPGVNFDAAQMMQLLVAPEPSTILPLLVGRGNVSLSKGITDKAGITPMIQIMAAEFVTLEGDKFVSELQIDEGRLLINGSPVPLALQ